MRSILPPDVPKVNAEIYLPTHTRDRKLPACESQSPSQTQTQMQNCMCSVSTYLCKRVQWKGEKEEEKRKREKMEREKVRSEREDRGLQYVFWTAWARERIVQAHPRELGIGRGEDVNGKGQREREGKRRLERGKRRKDAKWSERNKGRRRLTKKRTDASIHWSVGRPSGDRGK